MIALCLAGCVMFGVFIRPALVHDSNLPISVTGRRHQ